MHEQSWREETTVLLSTTGLTNANFIRLARGALADITRLTRTDKFYQRYKTMIQLGFGLGLVGAVVVSLIRSATGLMMTDSLGCYLGTVMVIAGIVLMFIAPEQGNTGKEGVPHA